MGTAKHYSVDNIYKSALIGNKQKPPEIPYKYTIQTSMLLWKLNARD